MRRIVVDAEDPGEPTRDHPIQHPPKLCEANETKPNFLHAGDHVHLGPGVTGQRVTNPAINLHDIPPVHLILLSHYHAYDITLQQLVFDKQVGANLTLFGQSDHFDQKVEDSLTRDIPIITTPHAKGCLESKGKDSFTQVEALDTYQSMLVEIKSKESANTKEPAIKITAMPGKHIPPGLLSTANDILHAVSSLLLRWWLSCVMKGLNIAT
ncbi:hypothetical protein MauCBS54593_000723 [Microsporum audouinii]